MTFFRLARPIVTGLCALAFGSIASPANAGSLAEWMAEPPKGSLTSERTALSLEYCIGLGVSDLTAISTIRGEGTTIIFGTVAGGASVAFVVAIKEGDAQRRLEFWASAARDDKVSAVLQRCS